MPFYVTDEKNKIVFKTISFKEILRFRNKKISFSKLDFCKGDVLDDPELEADPCIFSSRPDRNSFKKGDVVINTLSFEKYTFLEDTDLTELSNFVKCKKHETGAYGLINKDSLQFYSLDL